MSSLEGAKSDAGKPPMSLLPACAVQAEARVLGFGATKYAPDNWRGGFKWRRLLDATLRHVFALADGEDRDPETGELHTAHARCCLGFLHEHMERGLGEDDRYRADVQHKGRYDTRSAPAAPVGVQRASLGADALPELIEPAPPPTPKLPFSFWYIATPYSRYKDGPDAAFERACQHTALLLRLGIPCFSPIAHSHPIAKFGLMNRLDHDFWMNVDLPMMRAAGGLLVVQMPGWNDSVGIAYEIQTFTEQGKPVVHWDLDERPPLERMRASEKD